MVFRYKGFFWTPCRFQHTKVPKACIPLLVAKSITIDVAAKVFERFGEVLVLDMWPGGDGWTKPQEAMQRTCEGRMVY